jgi:hypothetical protein
MSDKPNERGSTMTYDYAMQAAEYETRKAVERAQAAALKKQYPHLVPINASNTNSLVTAGKNIRIELGRAFPGVKFAVRSSRFSGGNSLDVSWTDGPTTQQVDDIIGKYAQGHFDGMTDCYEYAHSAWTDAFGDAKYVHSRREYSDRMVEQVMGRVCRWLGGLEKFPTVEDFKMGNLWNFKQAGGCDVGRYVNAALAKHTYCLNQTVKGEQ